MPHLKEKPYDKRRRFPVIQDQSSRYVEMSLDQFLHNLGDKYLLTADEEIDLATKAQAGDLSALKRFIECNVRLVITVANKISYGHPEVPLDDLIEAGIPALEKAIRKFVPEKGYRFSTYAFHWIRQAIQRDIEKNERTIRLPVYVTEKHNRLNKIIIGFNDRYGRNPTFNELCQESGYTERLVTRILQSSQPILSLDQPLGLDKSGRQLGYELLETEAPIDLPEEVFQNITIEKIEKGLSNLNPQERLVIEKRFGLKDGNQQTLKEVSQALHISREWVRQIQNKALAKLRRNADVCNYLADPDS